MHNQQQAYRKKYVTPQEASLHDENLPGLTNEYLEHRVQKLNVLLKELSSKYLLLVGSLSLLLADRPSGLNSSNSTAESASSNGANEEREIDAGPILNSLGLRGLWVDFVANFVVKVVTERIIASFQLKTSKIREIEAHIKYKGKTLKRRTAIRDRMIMAAPTIEAWRKHYVESSIDKYDSRVIIADCVEYYDIGERMEEVVEDEDTIDTSWKLSNYDKLMSVIKHEKDYRNDLLSRLNVK